MDLFLAEYLKLLETMHGEIVKALEGLPDQAVSWTPAPGANSLAVLAIHTAGATRYWIGDVVMAEPSGRDRDAEFRTASVTVEEAVEPLRRSLLYAQTAIRLLTGEELAAKRIVPNRDREVTVSWALLHALEHAAMHAGHAQLTRQLWEAHRAGR